MITGSPSLRVLDVSENDIRDDGVFFCLQHTNTLTKISFEFCGFSAKGNCLLYYYGNLQNLYS